MACAAYMQIKHVSSRRLPHTPWRAFACCVSRRRHWVAGGAPARGGQVLGVVVLHGQSSAVVCTYRGRVGSCLGRCCAADPVGTCPTRPVVSPQKAFASAGAGYRQVGEPCTSASIPIPIPIPMPRAHGDNGLLSHCNQQLEESHRHSLLVLSCPALPCPALQTLSRRRPAVGRAGRAVWIRDWPCRSPSHIAIPTLFTRSRRIWHGLNASNHTPIRSHATGDATPHPRPHTPSLLGTAQIPTRPRTLRLLRHDVSRRPWNTGSKAFTAPLLPSSFVLPLGASAYRLQPWR